MSSEVIKKYIKNNLKSLKRTVVNLHKKWKYRNNSNSEVLWISIGENCLPDDILRRHKRKSFSSVFSSGRSNIEYAIQMERDGYKNLLKRDLLNYFPDGDNSVLRSIFYKDCEGEYSERHMIGFEFTHHDPLKIKEDGRAFKRRISRQLKYRGKKDFIFFYHHRVTEKSDLPLLRRNLNDFLSFYNINNCNCQIVLFYQNIIMRSEEKHIDFTAFDTGLLEFLCHTHDMWGGDDPEIFWAKGDDDLFTEIFSTVDNYKFKKGVGKVVEH